tara:strand:+ start:224 stop:400 length:177 start_codon:yes stop_codon:yes gene_type:complete
MKKIKIELEVKEGFSDDLKVGEYFVYKGEVYQFDGYDWGTYPMATNLETGEQKKFTHY